MSDTDDGFDEEAVREELREKYEDDDRGETERMSELLLQGATMTNQHCDRCGNPIFRYEGQSFCPNCQQAAEQGQGAGQGQVTGQQGASQPAQRPADGQQAEPEPSADARADDQQVREAAEASRQPREASQQPPETAQQAGNATAAAGGRESPSPSQSPARSQPQQSGQSSGAPSGEGAAALESSIAALARRAAGADDPRRAREFLEAAREAAEALDALRRNA